MLIVESVTLVQVDPYGCQVVAGDWFSVYDGIESEQPADFDVDHVVALAEAWDSGASAWDLARRRDFANDLGYQGSLVAVTASSNRSKGDNDPAEWLPPRREAWCSFATNWVTVKVRWNLTADEIEIAALRAALDTCDGSSPPTAPRTAPPTGSEVEIAVLDCIGERVTVTNGTSASADLSGWAIHDQGTRHSYTFRAVSQLGPGGSVAIRSGGPAGPEELQWTTAPVWNDDGDVAYLVDTSGEVRSTEAC